MVDWPEDGNYFAELGVRMKQSREKKYGKSHGTKKRCADDIGMSDQMWGDIESGRVKLNPQKIAFLADFFGVDAGWLLTGKASSPQPSGEECGQTLTPDQIDVISRLSKIVEILTAVLADCGKSPDSAYHVKQLMDNAWKQFFQEASQIRQELKIA